jgi:hypothetical protein
LVPYTSHTYKQKNKQAYFVKIDKYWLFYSNNFFFSAVVLPIIQQLDALKIKRDRIFPTEEG